MDVGLFVLKDGGVVLAADGSHHDIVKRVEYYREQRLFLIVYKNTTNEDELMHFEVPHNMIPPVEKSPDVIIYSMFDNHDPVGYKVPLIKVGNMF